MNILYLFLLLMAITTNGIALRTRQPYVKLLFTYLVSSLLVTLLAIYVKAYTRSESNLWLFHVFTPVEYTLFALFYFLAISRPALKKLILISIPIFILASILFSIFIQTISHNNSYIGIIESILIICWTLLFWRELLLLKHVKVLYRYPLFWISAGILVYFTETLVIEGLLDYLIKHSMGLALQAYKISYIFKYLLLVAFTIGAYYQIISGRTQAGRSGTEAGRSGTEADRSV